MFLERLIHRWKNKKYKNPYFISNWEQNIILSLSIIWWNDVILHFEHFDYSWELKPLVDRKTLSSLYFNVFHSQQPRLPWAFQDSIKLKLRYFSKKNFWHFTHPTKEIISQKENKDNQDKDIIKSFYIIYDIHSQPRDLALNFVDNFWQN